MFKARRTIAGAAAAVLALTLGGCSSGDGSGSSDASSSQTSTTFKPKDVADPGDDLLDRVRLGKVFAGTLLKPSWKFPSSYEPAAGDNTRAYSKDKHFRITIQAGHGDQSDAAAAMASGQRQSEAKGQKASLHTVSVNGREFAVLVQDTPEVAILTYAHAPQGALNFYIVQFAADMSLGDVPQEQLDAFQQTLGSLQVARA